MDIAQFIVMAIGGIGGISFVTKYASDEVASVCPKLNRAMKAIRKLHRDWKNGR